MPNPENIVPHQFTSDQDREKAAINGRKGGLALQAKIREAKTLRDTLKLLLEMPSEENPNITNREAVMVALMKKAMKGQVAAADLLGKYMGEYINKTEILTNKTAQEYAQEFLKSLKDE